MRLFLLSLLLFCVGCIPLRTLDTVDPNIPDVPDVPVVQPDGPVDPSPGGIRVLIVDENDDRVKPEMRAYLGLWNSSQIRSYLNSHCAKDVRGGPGWRWYQPDDNLAKDDPIWQELMNQPRKSTPWIYIVNDKGQGTSGPLSSDDDENLELLKKWGGP